MPIHKLSTNLSYKEAIRSNTAEREGIDNTPTDEELLNMQAVAKRIFQPIRDHAGCAIHVSSFFRCLELNRAVGGADSSQHTKGEAIDLNGKRYGGISNAEIFEFILVNLDFDQMIWEYGTDDEPAWVHVSYKRNGHNRKEVLRKRKGQPYERM